MVVRAPAGGGVKKAGHPGYAGSIARTLRARRPALPASRAGGMSCRPVGAAPPAEASRASDDGHRGHIAVSRRASRTSPCRRSAIPTPKAQRVVAATAEFTDIGLAIFRRTHLLRAPDAQ